MTHSSTMIVMMRVGRLGEFGLLDECRACLVPMFLASFEHFTGQHKHIMPSNKSCSTCLQVCIELLHIAAVHNGISSLSTLCGQCQ